MGDSLPDRTAAIIDGQVEPQEMSKNALKKAAKQEKLAAEKAHKSATNTTREAAKVGASKPTSKAAKTKAEGKDLISIDVLKEDDFPGWYQQVLTKGEMLDYYDVSGCYILKVCLNSSPNRDLLMSVACVLFYMGGNPSMVQQEDKEYRRRQLFVPLVCISRCPRAGEGPH